MTNEHRLTIRLPKKMYKKLLDESMETGDSISSIIRRRILNGA